ncbi:MAG TPA: L,D-transpeptidase [Thermoanaerobaculia bacterium]|nr:L,D-transpeptidase [Thermoanaerobaculia bacterium]
MIRRFLVLVVAILAVSADVQAALTLAASTGKKVLEVRVDGQTVKRYDIAVGSRKHRTPHGSFSVRHIVWNPGWVPPREKWAKGKKPTPPGHPDNPMRVVKIFFQEPDYYIHGTDQEESIGKAASHGCIRMTEADAFELGRYLMEHSGARRSDAWYEAVMSGRRPASVYLPTRVRMVIGK